ncbi:DNA-binding response regulator, OmpR family, contains REC and winged-helix (wHTH) domain [Roseateles sp. YR242]|uniref:winged helix-turn-helix transcriptional regulator n=1 Tax=Roseateles sp. YR242 TaxID=1855305 RepID=UPI0008B6CD33|nr:response regulator transcription factor [Roseateles sp. YR242]SEK25222.1 DNA-binding response regulator, OmpR family, contains REC and winged-helix (wHTH) domain [Roseateles sp. YR242]
MKVATLCPSRSFEHFSATALRGAGYEPLPHVHLSPLIAALREPGADAVLLEDHDTQVEGWLSALRLHAGRALPIVVLGLGDSVGISRALQRGADDYAVLADGASPLIHRLRARIQSRADGVRATSLRAGPYSLHASTQSLSTGAREVSLTAREFALAWTLFENLGRVVSTHTLSTEIWGRTGDVGKRTLEQHVYKLRLKLDPDGRRARGLQHETMPAPRIQTVYGVGYRLEL